MTPEPGDVLAGLHVWVGPYRDVVRLTLNALPLAAVVAGTLVRRRCQLGIGRALAWRRSLSDVGIVYGTAPFLWLVMLPRPQVELDSGGVSLVPLRDLATMPTSQVVGNLLGLAALGFFAPVRFAALASLRRVLAVAAAASLLIETVQYVLPLGRVASIDDVLLNTAGAGVAALVSLPWWHEGDGDTCRRGRGRATGQAADSSASSARLASSPPR
jgi:hypothetical protein